MKIAMAQMDVKAGYPEQNIATMSDWVQTAKAEGADIIVFPELCVGGYLIGDLWLDDEYCKYLMSFNDKIREMSDGIGVIFGNVYLFDEPIKKNDTRFRSIDGSKENIKFCSEDGRKVRVNAAYFYQNKKAVKRISSSKIIPDGIQPKMLLPNYRYFDDKRYFVSAWNFYNSYNDSLFSVTSPFDFDYKGQSVRIGVEICEDMWCKDYNINPSFALSAQDSYVIINISASPWTCGKNKTRDKQVGGLLDWDQKKYKYTYDYACDEKPSDSWISQNEKDKNKLAFEEGRYSSYDESKYISYPAHPIFVYVNCVGAQNNGKNILVFDGASTVYGNDGKPRIFANSNYEEELLIFDTENMPDQILEREEEQDIPRKYQAIIRGIRHISETSNITKYVVGVSGGIDSALVLCLLSQAVGVNNIIAVNMPSKYNSKLTKSAAKRICERLGIKDYRVIPINKIVKSKKDSIYKDRYLKSATEENIQAETRGMILSAIAGEEKAIFTCNANKNEIFIGYATLNGDMRGAICPIADLEKSRVYQMGEYVNKVVFKRTVIPNNLFPNKNYQFVGKTKIQPSAELKEKQVDPIKIGYHCKLIEQLMDYKKIGPNQIMQWWLDGELHWKIGISLSLLRLYGMTNGTDFIEDLKFLCNRRASSVFKRVQSPPIIALTKTAFGYDLRESILPVSDKIFSQELIEKIHKKGKYEN